jgi:hypothetical protein
MGAGVYDVRGSSWNCCLLGIVTLCGRTYELYTAPFSGGGGGRFFFYLKN